MQKVDERPGSQLVLVDAGAVAGWRRPKPSLAQLHQALLHLQAQHRDAKVAVVADPALKHQLPADEQPDFEADIALGVVVCAPAGTIGGADGFFAAVAERAERDGAEVVAITDRAVSFGKLVQLRRDERRWTFDLAAATPPKAGATPARRRRRR